MARPIRNVRKHGGGFQVNVRMGRAPIVPVQCDTEAKAIAVRDELEAKRRELRKQRRTARPASGSFGADIAAYIDRDKVKAKPTYKQIVAHLNRWADALGRDMPRADITAPQIEDVMSRWSTTPTVIAKGQKGRPAPNGLSAGAIRKRYRNLMGLFVAYDGKKTITAMRLATPPAPTQGEIRSIDYADAERVIAAMAPRIAERGAKPETSIARLVAAVMLYTGIPPGMIKKLKPTDLTLTPTRTAAGIVPGLCRVSRRSKAKGIEARELPISEDAVAALRAFHAADLYGTFATESVNRAVKRAAFRAGIRKAFRLYDLRHTFLTQVWRSSGDLATVAWLGLHAPGSPITIRYALAASADVGAVAIQKFDRSLAAIRTDGTTAVGPARTAPEPLRAVRRA